MSGNALELINNFLPLMQKYSNIKIKEVEINVTKFDDGVTMEIKCDENAVGDMLSDMMIMISKLAQTSDGKISVSVDDKRG